MSILGGAPIASKRNSRSRTNEYVKVFVFLFLGFKSSLEVEDVDWGGGEILHKELSRENYYENLQCLHCFPFLQKVHNAFTCIYKGMPVVAECSQNSPDFVPAPNLRLTSKAIAGKLGNPCIQKLDVLLMQKP